MLMFYTIETKVLIRQNNLQVEVGYFWFFFGLDFIVRAQNMYKVLVGRGGGDKPDTIANTWGKCLSVSLIKAPTRK